MVSDKSVIISDKNFFRFDQYKLKGYDLIFLNIFLSITCQDKYLQNRIYLSQRLAKITSINIKYTQRIYRTHIKYILSSNKILSPESI